jgi:hypothetical protein
MRFLQSNLIESATLTASNENGSFPVGNIQDTILASVFRSTSTSVNIVIDLGVAKTCDIFFLAKHNMTSSATVTLEANSSDVWTSPPFSESITVEDLIAADFTAASYRYWRLVIADGTNTDGYIKIGGLGLGEYYAVPGIGIAYQVNHFSTALKYTSQSGQVYGSSGVFYRSVNVQIPYVTQAQRVEIESCFNTKDWYTPFYVQFNESCVSENALYATLEANSIGFQSLSTQPIAYSSQMTLMEAR